MRVLAVLACAFVTADADVKVVDVYVNEVKLGKGFTIDGEPYVPIKRVQSQLEITSRVDIAGDIRVTKSRSAITPSLAPSPRGGTYFPSRYKLSIKEKSDDGTIIILDDRSIWLIDSIDRIDTSLWMELNDVMVLEKKYGGFELLNVDDKEKVDATYLGRS